MLGTGIILGMGWGGIPNVAPGHPMMSLSMGGQGPRRQARVVIRASDPLAEPFPVDVYLTLHPEAVGLRMKGKVNIYWKRLCQRVRCPD